MKRGIRIAFTACWVLAGFAGIANADEEVSQDYDKSIKKAEKSEDGWIKLFNGKDFSGWRISEDGKWKIEDGRIVANGPRSHLFTEDEFKNFIFKAEVKTTPGSNSGIYFHTEYQEEGWPEKGHESQVNVTHKDPVKTGSLYNVVKRFKTPAKDNEWWTQTVIVKGQQIIDFFFTLCFYILFKNGISKRRTHLL